MVDFFSLLRTVPTLFHSVPTLFPFPTLFHSVIPQHRVTRTVAGLIPCLFPLFPGFGGNGGKIKTTMPRP